jgi:hypothetical protein
MALALTPLRLSWQPVAIVRGGPPADRLTLFDCRGAQSLVTAQQPDSRIAVEVRLALLLPILGEPPAVVEHI